MVTQTAPGNIYAVESQELLLPGEKMNSSASSGCPGPGQLQSPREHSVLGHEPSSISCLRLSHSYSLIVHLMHADCILIGLSLDNSARGSGSEKIVAGAGSSGMMPHCFVELPAEGPSDAVLVSWPIDI